MVEVVEADEVGRAWIEEGDEHKKSAKAVTMVSLSMSSGASEARGGVGLKKQSEGKQQRQSRKPSTAGLFELLSTRAVVVSYRDTREGRSETALAVLVGTGRNVEGEEDMGQHKGSS